MKSVEITYSFHPSALPPTPLPADIEAARRRLEDGNQLFVTLLDQIKRGAGTERHIMRLDPRHLGLLPGETGAPATALRCGRGLRRCQGSDRADLQ